MDWTVITFAVNTQDTTGDDMKNAASNNTWDASVWDGAQWTHSDATGSVTLEDVVTDGTHGKANKTIIAGAVNMALQKVDYAWDIDNVEVDESTMGENLKLNVTLSKIMIRAEKVNSTNNRMVKAIRGSGVSEYASAEVDKSGSGIRAVGATVTITISGGAGTVADDTADRGKVIVELIGETDLMMANVCGVTQNQITLTVKEAGVLTETTNQADT